MAATLGRWWVPLLQLQSAMLTVAMTELQLITEGIQQMEASVLRRFDTDSGYSQAKEGFEQFLYPAMSVKKIDINSIADEYETKLQHFIDKHREQLRHLVRKVEDRAQGIDPTRSMPEYSYEYLDVGKLQQTEPSKTGLHFPIEVIRNSSTVKRDLYITGASTVTNQMKRDGEGMFRQYISTETGITRIFPARPWLKSSDRKWTVDLFDPRFRPWYVSAVSAPKDVLFLLDFSGSVTGQTFHLMKSSVLSVLSLLTPNDYINAVWYNSKVGSVLQHCFNGFLPANTRNKIMLHRYLNDVEPFDIAHVGPAVNYSLSEFARNPEVEYPGLNHRSAGHQVMLMLTDWIEGWNDAYINEHKPLNADGTRNVSVRIFGYNVGFGAEFIDTLHWLSCTNKGYYSMINSLSDVKYYSRMFVPVLSRPLALTYANSSLGPEARPVSYTGPYMDAQGAGSIMTLSMAISNTVSNASKQTFLGVAAIDIKLSTLVNMVTDDLLGLGAYMLAVDNNGYLIHHPKQKLPEPDFQAIRRTACVDVSEPMKALSGGAKIMYGPSTEKTTQQMSFIDTVFLMDFLDLEPENEDTTMIRRRMINRECGKNVFVDRETGKSYTCRPIADTEFSFAIVAETNAVKLTFNAEEPFPLPTEEAVNRSTVQTLMPSKYFCRDGVDLSSVMSHKRLLHLLYIHADQPLDDICAQQGSDDARTQHVLAEYRALQQWRRRWPGIDNDSSNDTCTIRLAASRRAPANVDLPAHHKLVFIQTASSAAHIFTNCTHINLPPSLVHGKEQSAFFDAVKDTDTKGLHVHVQGSSIVALRPFIYADSHVAVAGVFYKPYDFSVGGHELLNTYCNQSLPRICYVMTRQLHVLYTSDAEAATGVRHLSWLDWQLFDHLNDSALITKTSVRDYQSDCPTTTFIYDTKKGAVSAAAPRPGLTAMLSALWHNVIPALGLLTNVFSQSVHPRLLVNAKPPRGRGRNGSCPYANKGSVNEESCIMEYDTYSYTAALHTASTAQTGDCEPRQYTIVPFNSSNLLFVTVDAACEAPAAAPITFRLQRRIAECDEMKIRYRKRPADTTYSLFDASEDTTECGAERPGRVSLLVAATVIALHVFTPGTSRVN